MVRNNCDTCANRVRDGYGYKCRITGLHLKTLNQSCLCYEPMANDTTVEARNEDN